MRRCLMWLMICLLPLRLWAGDAMAVQHTPPAAPGVAVAAVQDAHPCHGTEAQPMAHGDDGADATAPHTGAGADDSTHGSTCGDCNVCHGPLAGLALPTWAAPTLPSAVPRTVGWPALSANAPPHLKPPRV